MDKIRKIDKGQSMEGFCKLLLLCQLVLTTERSKEPFSLIGVLDLSMHLEVEQSKRLAADTGSALSIWALLVPVLWSGTSYEAL